MINEKKESRRSLTVENLSEEFFTSHVRSLKTTAIILLVVLLIVLVLIFWGKNVRLIWSYNYSFEIVHT